MTKKSGVFAVNTDLNGLLFKGKGEPERVTSTQTISNKTSRTLMPLVKVI